MPSRVSRRQAIASLAAWAAASPLLRAQHAPVDELVNTLEFEREAKQALNADLFAKIAGGDRSAFERMTFRQRLMVDAAGMDLSIDLLGQTLFAPILAGAAARQRRFHPEAELAMARGAAAAKAPMAVTAEADLALPQIVAQAPPSSWFQLRLGAEKTSVVVNQAREAVDAGCRVLGVSASAPTEVEWTAIQQLRNAVDVPLVLKGVMSAAQAQDAREHGLDGVVVSNYGRGAKHPMDALPAVAEGVRGDLAILIDGGIRRGSDVLKALALGANAVLVTRPVLWGLAAYGARGVQTVLELLQTELANDMAMIGAPNVAAIERDMVRVDKRR